MSESAQVTVCDGTLELRNQFWLLQVGIKDTLDPRLLLDVSRGLTLADESYCYDLVLGPLGDSGFTGQMVSAQRVRCLSWASADLPGGGQEVRLRGRFDFGLLGPTDIEIEHVFRLPDAQPWFEEQIRLIHRFGRDEHDVRHIRFAFRKILFDRDHQSWRDGVDQRYVVAVPHRRRWGQVVDHRVNTYTMNDLIPGNWSGDQLPGRAAEAWVWTDGKTGYLIAKYNREQMEFGLVDGEFVIVPSKRADDYYRTFDPIRVGGVSPCFRFGGAGRYCTVPERIGQIRRVSAGVDYAFEFGITRIYPIVGDWQEGYKAYKGFLLEKGHRYPEGFDPPVHWNELYNLGWRGGENAPLQELPELYQEAATARDIGAEAFYFDPVWDIFEGSSIWDEARLGSLDEFVRTMRDSFGLSTSLHLMMHTKSMDEDPRIYRRRQDGSIDVFGGLYSGGYICAASPAWQQQKIERLLRLAQAGVSFFMFDFLSHVPPDSQIKTFRPPSSTCWDRGHGHEVPVTMQSHAEGILQVIQAVKKQFPGLLIEAHDRVTGGMQDFHPLYFQHGLPDSFDENWGFEYMWDPFMDLLSGKALSLYEYNLAYDIPLYLHIHCGQDNENMLAFWWYASTCRHLGIGGVKDPASLLYRALKRAMVTYRRLKPFFARGRFIGIEPLIHCHALPQDDACVFALFNLGSQPITHQVDVPLAEIGITSVSSVRGADVHLAEGRLSFAVTVAPLSPSLVEINTGQ